MEISDGGTQLKIHSSKLHDEGLYTCVAMNTAGNATQKQQLYVGGSQCFRLSLAYRMKINLLVSAYYTNTSGHTYWSKDMKIKGK